MKDKKDSSYFSKKIEPAGIRRGISLNTLIDTCFTAYNARAFRDACRLMVEKILSGNITIGMSLTGALTPAGLGRSCLVPLIQSGYVDWIVSTGANLYHDLHACLGYAMYEGSPKADDCQLRKDEVIRIHDIFFAADALYDTDAFIRQLFRNHKFDGPVATVDVHQVLGRTLLKQWPDSRSYSVLAAAAKMDVPIHTSSPGDSSLGMNLAALALEGKEILVDPNLDVNLSAAWVYDAKQTGGKTAAIIFGGGSPKNFLLQTEPQIQEILGLKEAGHDFFIQFTDARVDTGGLSGATPFEAVSWGKIDPSSVGSSQVCYGDCSIYLPLFTAYLMNSGIKRKPKRLWRRKQECWERLVRDFDQSKHKGK